MNKAEYEATFDMIKRMFVILSSQVKEPSKELDLQFIYYGMNLPEEETKQTLTELITKALELDDKVSITDLETSRFNPNSDPGFLCKCKLVANEGMLVCDARILTNTLLDLKNLIINDIIKHTLTKHAYEDTAISILTGEPYFIGFTINEEATEELLKLIKPQYEMIKKMINNITKNLDLMLEVIKLEPEQTTDNDKISEIIENNSNRIRVVIHLRFVQDKE